MADPWERPPFPPKGDARQHTLFAAIGRALNAWEEIEISLAHLYSTFVAGNRFDPVASHAYGESAAFVHRLTGLQEVAAKHFVAYPSQNIEGEFCRLSRITVGYSARRNDIAHAHVLHIHWVRDPASSKGLLSSGADLRWCLVPPFFRANKFTPSRQPAYVFTSWELNEYCEVFWDIARAVSSLSLWVENQRPPPSRDTRPRPGALPYMIRVPRIR